jgi:glycosyltransferase involved in cell wall biosynthesis
MTTEIIRNPALPNSLRMSIIIPTFNRIAILQEAIPSLQRQQFEDFEIIIVDNGPSTDGTGDCVKALMQDDPRIVYISTTEQGDFVARTIGCEHARGEIILTTDDDWEMISPDSLSYIDQCFRDDQRLGVLGLAPDTDTLREMSAPTRLTSRLKRWVMLNLYKPGRISRWGTIGTRYYYLPMGAKHEVDHVRGCCMGFPREVGRQIGFFPTLYNDLYGGGHGYRSETEVCCRIARLGYKVIYSTELMGLHKSAKRPEGTANRVKSTLVIRRQALVNTVFFLRNFWSQPSSPLFLIADILAGNRGQPGLIYFLLNPRYILHPQIILASLRGKFEGYARYRQSYAR